MDVSELLKKNVNRLLQQFGDKIGAGQPTQEHLDMFSLTLEAYQDGLLLLTADLEEKERQRMKALDTAADKEKVDDSGDLLDITTCRVVVWVT